LDQQLKKAKKKGGKRFLICWNRGLGDIPLGLYALTHRIRSFIPDASITFITRSDLADGFQMLPSISTVIDSEWKRGRPFDLDATLQKQGLDRSHFDVILEKPDPTRWLLWQLGKLTPKLVWNPDWDALAERFSLPKEKAYIGVHIQTETQYAYEKNWPLEFWQAFLQRIVFEQNVEIILFGFAPYPAFEGKGICDLRGKTSLCDMLSIIKNYCRVLLVPDSGVLSMTYYVDAAFPIDIVSLWADPKQGVLRQKVLSPNPRLRHHPLIADNGDLRTLSVDDVMEQLRKTRALC
jgi:ADP-heptose:LPS heptosyltransferase